MKEGEKRKPGTNNPVPKHHPVHKFYKQPTGIGRQPEGELGHGEIEHGCPWCNVPSHQVDTAQSLTVVLPTDLFSMRTTAEKPRMS